MPQDTGKRLFKEIVKTGAFFVLRGQKWPKTAKMAIFDEAMLITRKLFRSEVPGHHSPILGQHPSHLDALIRHICENGGQFWPLGGSNMAILGLKMSQK
jgi:hypothetical protein